MKGEIPHVFVVDDDSSTRKSFVNLLQTIGYPVEEFASAEEFLGANVEPRTGCVLADIRLPGMDGFELQARLLERRECFSIVFVTGYADVPMAVRAMKSGATAFMTKPVREEQLIEAVEQALAICRREASRRSEMDAVKQLYETLTAREVQVLALVASGKPNKQTAAHLGIVENTVKVHRRRIMKKMRADSLAELVLLAQKLDLIQDLVLRHA